MKRYLFFGSILLLLQSCIGTDILDVQPIPERVVFTASLEAIKVGEAFTFEATHYDKFGMATSNPIAWSTSNAAVMTIGANGRALANSEGMVTITARSGEAVNSIEIEVGDETIGATTQRMGTLQGLSDYTVEGGFTLFEDQGGLILRLEDDFQASNGPGLYLYLATSATSVTGGAQLGPLEMNSGSQLYEVPEGVTLETYDFLIVYCQPFGVPFGFGEFDN
ncbi:MAG: DM13 domain-containing protein [Cyclobacteriaceae bacterium]